MSEAVAEVPEVETTDVPEEEQEPSEEPTPLEPDEPTDEDAEDDPEPEPAPTQAHSEAWWEQAWKKSEKENDKHAAAVSRIFEEESQEFDQCPMCLNGPAGWLVTAHFSEEHANLIKLALGLESPDEYEPMPGAVLCETCKGKGKVRTPSLVDGHVLLMCPDCSETGWKHVAGPSGGAYTPLAPPQVSLNGELQPLEPLPFDAWSRPLGHPHYGIPPADVTA